MKMPNKTEDTQGNVSAVCLFESQPEAARFAEHQNSKTIQTEGILEAKVFQFGRLFTSRIYQNSRIGKLLIHIMVFTLCSAVFSIYRPRLVVLGAPMLCFRVFYRFLRKFTQCKTFYFVAYQVCDLEIMTIYPEIKVIAPTSIAPSFEMIGHTTTPYETATAARQLPSSFKYEAFLEHVGRSKARVYFIMDAYQTHNNVADRLSPEVITRKVRYLVGQLVQHCGNVTIRPHPREVPDTERMFLNIEGVMVDSQRLEPPAPGDIAVGVLSSYLMDCADRGVSSYYFSIEQLSSIQAYLSEKVGKVCFE